MIAGRLRDWFGGVLQTLYVLPENPGEPAGEEEWVVLAAVLDDAYHEQNNASRRASQVGCAFETAVDGRYVVTGLTLSAAENGAFGMSSAAFSSGAFRQ